MVFFADFGRPSIKAGDDVGAEGKADFDGAKFSGPRVDILEHVPVKGLHVGAIGWLQPLQSHAGEGLVHFACSLFASLVRVDEGATSHELIRFSHLQYLQKPRPPHAGTLIFPTAYAASRTGGRNEGRSRAGARNSASRFFSRVVP